MYKLTKKQKMISQFCKENPDQEKNYIMGFIYEIDNNNMALNKIENIVNCIRELLPWDFKEENRDFGLIERINGGKNQNDQIDKIKENISVCKENKIVFKSLVINNNTLICLFHPIVADIRTVKLFRDLCDTLAKSDKPKRLIEYKKYCQWVDSLSNNIINDQMKYSYLLSDYKKTDELKNNKNISFFQEDIINEKEIKDIELLKTRIIQSFYYSWDKYYGDENPAIFVACDPRQIAGNEQIIGPLENGVILSNSFMKIKGLSEQNGEIKENLQSAKEYSLFPSTSSEKSETSNSATEYMNSVFFSFNKVNETLIMPKLPLFNSALSLNIQLEGNNLRIQLAYKKNRFESKKLSLFYEYFLYILKSESHNFTKTSKTTKDILLSDSQISELRQLSTGNKSKISDSLIGIFKNMVNKFPNKVGVVSEKKQLTYKELDELSSKLANFFKNNFGDLKNGIGLNITAEADTVAIMLSCVKLGIPYVPLDLELSKRRIDYIIQTSQIELIITDESGLRNNVECLKKEDLINSANSYSSSFTINDSLDNNPVYEIFTSGTTGRPKGTVLKQSNIINLIYGINNEFYRFKTDDRMALFTSFGFDPSVIDIYGSLLTGGTVYLPEREIVRDIESYISYLVKNKITDLMVTTPVLKVIDELCGKHKPHLYLKNIFVGGETLTGATFRNIKKLYPNVQILNIYGPTETTVAVTFYKIGVRDYDSSNIPIGTPIENVEVFVVDSNNNLLPLGAPGELLIGGKCVGLGYKNLPKKTAESFINIPNYQEVLYKTGDIAAWEEHSGKYVLRFYGRKDKQVKINGYRIELDEIQSVVDRLDYIKNSVVLVRENDAKEKVICLYYVPKEKAEKTQILNDLRRVLPRYMVPRFLCEIAKIPLNNHDKVDYNKLPEISYDKNNEYIAPQTKNEKLVASTFESVLKLEKNLLGCNDNFFALGGHSLNVIAACDRLEEITNIRVPVKDFYSNPTVSMLAKFLDEEKQHKRDNKSVTLKSIGHNGEFTMSNAQKRMYIINQENPSDLSYNAPIEVKLNKLVDVVKLKKAIELVIKNNEILRTTFTYKDGNYLQIVHNNYKEAFEFKEVSKFNANFVRPFNLKTGPLIRVEVKIDKKDSITDILLDMHHIICDLLSQTIIYKQITDAYNGSEVQQPKFQYKDYSQWSLNRDKTAARSFWQSKIKEAGTQKTRLPKSISHSGDNNIISKISLDQNIVKKIKKVSKELSISPFTCFLGSWLIFLNHISNEEQLTTGVPVSGRDDYRLKNMLGLFVNTIPYTKKIPSNKKLGQFLQEVNTDFINCESYQYYPLDDMVSEFNIKPNQMFNTMLVYNESLIPVDDNVSIQELSTVDKKVDLLAGISKNTDNYDLVFESKLLDKKLLESYCDDFIEILSNIDCINSKVTDIKYLSQKEVNKIVEYSHLDLSNKDSIPFIDPMMILEKRAEKSPDELAIYSSEKIITNNELFRLVKSRAIEIKENTESYYVGVNTHRSIETLINIYAITYCGKAFVPIDIQHFSNRDELIVKELDINCILSDQTTITEPKTKKVKTLYYSNLEKTNQYDFSYKKPVPNDIAYVIYTSGSTGKPKGVKISRNSLYKSMYQFCQDFEWNQEDKFLLKTNLSFDVSLTEVWSWIYSKGTLYIPNDNIEYDSEELIREVVKQQITRLNFVPTAFEIFLNSSKKHLEKVTSLKGVYVAGEHLSQKTIKKYIGANYKFKLINAYGPTEDTVYASAQPIDSKAEKDSIGCPLTGKSIVVLNRFNKICPVGVSGEICIAGLGLSEGYIKANDKNEKSFIDIQLFGQTMRIYKTGDIGRWSENGQLIFEGRQDSQVKIRGFRVELNEVIAQLDKLPGIIESTVLPIKNNQDESLVGFVKYKNSYFDETRIKAELKNKLPQYMVPSVIVQIDEFPKNSNGKLDNKQLLSLVKRATKKTSPETNVTPLQKELLKIINEISVSGSIEVDDNIFYSDITSIGIMRFIERAKQILPFNYPDLLKYKSIKELTENKGTASDEKKRKKQNKDILPIKPPISTKQYNNEVNKVESSQSIRLTCYDKYLLLGSTGFLGIHLLHEILLEEQSLISVIIRSDNVTEALKKLKSKYSVYYNDFDKLDAINRIKIFSGDIAQKNFGLTPVEYKNLLENTQILINAAANVKHHDLFNNIWEPNVVGVKNIVAFCAQNRSKLVQISTISIGSGSVPSTKSVTFSELDFNIGQTGLNEYVYSKLVAESIVARAVENKEIDAQIIRIGNICFDSKNGQLQADISSNAFFEIVKSLLSMKILPERNSVSLDLTYVDQAAKAVLSLVKVENDILLYHLANPLSKKEMLVVWNKLMSMYPDIREVSLSEIGKIQKNTKNSNNSAIENLNIYTEDNTDTKFVIKNELTDAVLKKIGFSFPKISEKLVEDMINYGQKIHFFE